MIIQRCPRCDSNRIRPGYRRTPWWWAIFGRYNLLCNACNWEFVGLAVPGTVAETARKRKKSKTEKSEFQTLKLADQPPLVAAPEATGEIVKLKEVASHDVIDETDLIKIEKQTANSESTLNGTSQLNTASFDEFNDKILPDAGKPNDSEVADEVSKQAEVDEIAASLDGDALASESPKVKNRVRRKKKK